MTTDNDLEEIAEIIKDELLPLLSTSLSACADRHQLTATEGSDSFSFGTDAWSFPKNAFKKHIHNGSSKLEVSSKSGCVLLFNGYEIRHHKVGDSASNNIHSSFPKGAKAIAEDSKAQYSFDFLNQEPLKTRHIVLAYMANPDDGLCSAFLATPEVIENNKIISWASTIELYKRDDITEHIVQNNGTKLTETEIVAEPVVTMTRKRIENDG